MADERRRDATFDQVVEVGERASRILLLERDPAEIVGGIGAELRSRVVLHHEREHALGLAHASEPQERLTEPVARLPLKTPIARFLARFLERVPRLLQLAALEASAAALDQLGSHA